MVPIGAGGIAMAATANATIQLAVPDGLRGRVMSVYTTVFSASIPIGGLAAGALASVVGIPVTVAIGGVLSLAVGIGRVRLVVAPAAMRPPRHRPRAGSPTRAASAAPRRSAADERDRAQSDGAEHERRVQAAEPERGAQHPPVGPVPALAQQARQQRRRVRIGLDEVDRRRRPAIADGQRADRRLDRARRPERVAVQRLRAADRDRRRALAEGRRDRPRLGDVADRRRRGVGVDVVDLVGVDAGVVERDRRGPRRLAAVGPRLDHVVGVGGRAVAEQLRVRRRARGARPPSASSSTSSAAPSPMTNPSRPTSNGRAAAPGSSLWPADSARMMSNAPNASGDSGISQPPAIAASTRPSRRSPSASPSATAPEAHEFAVDRIGPRTSSAMPRLAGAAPPNTASARFGATWRMPFSR